MGMTWVNMQRNCFWDRFRDSGDAVACHDAELMRRTLYVA
jgi:hypothetical protein